MTQRETFKISCIIVLSGMCALRLLQPAWGDDSSTLQAESAKNDSSSPADSSPNPSPTALPNSSPTATTPSANSPINLSARKRGIVEDSSTENGGSLAAEASAKQAPTPFQLFVGKTRSGVALTAEDYRSLGIGIAGYDYDRKYNEKEGNVTAVYAGCPAAAAGIKVGDTVIVEDAEIANDNTIVADHTTESWLFTSGRAGDIENIKLRRNGKVEVVQLTRMNIEDIQDPKLRSYYEKLVQEAGRKEGTVQVKEPKHGSFLKQFFGH